MAELQWYRVPCTLLMAGGDTMPYELYVQVSSTDDALSEAQRRIWALSWGTPELLHVAPVGYCDEGSRDDQL
jgi:hypothetical protein